MDKPVWPHVCPTPSPEGPMFEETTEGNFDGGERWRWKCLSCGLEGGRGFGYEGMRLMPDSLVQLAARKVFAEHASEIIKRTKALYGLFGAPRL